MSRGMTWYDERDFIKFQTLPLRYYKMLKRLRLEEREEAYLGSSISPTFQPPLLSYLDLGMSITSLSLSMIRLELSL